MPDSATRSRSELAERLRSRRPEIESTLLTRVNAVADPGGAEDPLYSYGLRAAVAAALEYGIDCIETGEERARAVPLPLLTQARQAARSGVGLDTVLRRYIAGYALLSDFVLEEAEAAPINGMSPKRLLRAQAVLLDRLLDGIAAEYAREAAEHRLAVGEQRRAERIRRLLAGEPIDTADLAYDFESAHLGAIAAGPGAEPAIREFATKLGCRLLLVEPGEGLVWAWLGNRRRPDAARLERALRSWTPAVSLALGEWGDDLAGWRLTHRQARAALPVALRYRSGPVRYGEVAVLASCLRDDLLLTSLRELFLEPLGIDADDAGVLCETLAAYFATNRNITSAAACLGVSRQTVRARLRTVEERLGRTLESCGVELRMAIELQQHLC